MNDIRIMVREIVEQYKTADPFELCDLMDIIVLRTDLPDKINGFYTTLFNCKFVYLNNKLNHAMLAKICAHELGHAVLHPDENSILLGNHSNEVKSRLEMEANYFSDQLLRIDAI